MRSTALLTAAALAATMAPAAAEPMNASSLKDTVIGKGIYLAIPLGGEFPLHYRSNGVVEGQAPNSLLVRLSPKSDTGRWWIDGDKLCQQWKIWYERKTYCFTLENAGPSKLNWVRNDGLSGKARITN